MKRFWTKITLLLLLTKSVYCEFVLADNYKAITHVTHPADSASKNKPFLCDSNNIDMNDPGKVMALYESCLNTLERIGRNDKLFQTKRRLMMKVITLYLKHGRFERAYQIAFAWIKQDKWDMDAKIHYARVLRLTPGKEQEALEYYEYLKKEFYNLPIDQWLIKK